MLEKTPFSARRILIHATFWTGYLILTVFVFFGRTETGNAFQLGAIQLIPQIIIAYINMEWLIPTYFAKKKFWKYTLGVVVCFFGLYVMYTTFIPGLVSEILNLPPYPSRGRHGDRPEGSMYRFFFHRGSMIFFFTQITAVYFLSTAYKTIQIAAQKERESTRLRNENLQTELKFLRSQINPHFLFNALNNIYTLSVIKSDSAPEMILKLSEMLRYVIYDCNEELVPLEKEINYLKNYIDLQKLKDDKITNITFDIDTGNTKLMISPMLLIPFVENSFKHSKIEDLKQGWINIKLTTENRRIEFQIRNNMPEKGYTKDKTGGVGLENVRRRLELLYPKNHKLMIEQEQNTFMVSLTIQL